MIQTSLCYRGISLQHHNCVTIRLTNSGTYYLKEKKNTLCCVLSSPGLSRFRDVTGIHFLIKNKKAYIISNCHGKDNIIVF